MKLCCRVNFTFTWENYSLLWCWKSFCIFSFHSFKVELVKEKESGRYFASKFTFKEFLDSTSFFEFILIFIARYHFATPLSSSTRLFSDSPLFYISTNPLEFFALCEVRGVRCRINNLNVGR